MLRTSMSFEYSTANRRLGTWIFLLAVFVRVYVLFRLYGGSYVVDNQGDMRFYHAWGIRIAEGEWTDRQAFYGLPGYAYLLGAFYKIIGIYPLIVCLAHALVEGFVANLIFNIANLIFFTATRLRFAQVIAVLAGLGYVFYLPAQAFSAVLMPTVLLTAAFWAILRWCLTSKPPQRGWTVFGIGTGIGAMATIAAGIFFALPLVIAVLIRNETRKFALYTALLLIGVLLGCSPAILHNRLLAHDNVALSAHGGLNFFIGNNDEANGYLKIPSELHANQEQMLADSITVAEKAIGGTHPIKRSAVSAYWSDQAKAYIREHPFAWLRLLGQKIVNFWNAYSYDDLSLIHAFADENITTPGIEFGIISALGLAGMVVSLNSPLRASRWLIAAIALHLGSLLTVFITERYRLAAVPGLLIFSAYFIVQLWENAIAKKWSRIAIDSFVVFAATIFVTVPVPNQGAWALDAYNHGLRLLAANNFPAAENQLQLAWCYAPENENTNLALGNLFLSENQSDRAERFFTRTLRLNPQNTAALNNMGFIALEAKAWNQAAEFYSKTLEIAPANWLAAYQLASIYSQTGRPERALQTLDAGLALHPNQKALKQLRQEMIVPKTP